MIKFSGKKDSNTNFKCTVRLLDDNDVLECEFQSFHKGRYLLDFVFNYLDLLETDYFGLRYIDQQKQRHWLDGNKNILRQIKGLSPILFCFRVKFYPADPLKLHEEITRYYLFLQLRRDLLHGRLYCVQNDAAILAAYIIQGDHGEASTTDDQDSSYISDYKILLKQTPKVEEKIAEIHKSLSGLSPAMAELYFLKKASTLDTYGVDPYSVKDHRGLHLYLGLSHAGILTFQGSKRMHHFRWSEVQKLNYEGKMFIIHLIFMEDARTKRKHTVGYKCSSASACRNLWRAAVEQRLFYTMDNSSKQGLVVTGGSFFSRGSKFRYQGRCEKEVIEESSSIDRDPPEVKRVPLKNVGRSTSLPTTPADSDNYESVMSRVHRPLPYIDRSTSLDEEVLCDAESPSPAHDLYANGSFSAVGGAYCPESTLPPLSQLETLAEDNENKFHDSSLSDKYVDGDTNSSLDYFDRTSQTYSPLSTLKGSHTVRESPAQPKRLYRHAAIKDDDFLPAQIYCDCEELRPEYDRDDSSSTDTLGPPTEPLDVPFNQKGVESSFTQSPQPQQQFSSQSKEPQMQPNTPTAANSTNPEKDKFAHETTSIPSNLITPRKKIIYAKVGSLSSLSSSLFRFSRVFIVTFILVVLTLVIFSVIVFETDVAYLDTIKSSREMVLLRVQYYEPMKKYLFKNILGNNK
ncbi:UNVERIFIED_CONTAM: hypothetical protein RMT77_000075 [Armadillidium vulgare]